MHQDNIVERFLFTPISLREQRIIALLFSCLLFGLLLLFAGIKQPDLKDHFLISESLVSGKHLIAHPVFFFLLQLFSGFSGQPFALMFAAFLCFSIAQYGKILQSTRLCENIGEKPTTRLFFILILLSQVAIGFVLFQPFFTKLSLSPNFFHNGTLLLSLPPALFLLNKTICFIRDGNRKHLFHMILAGIAIILTKPSFLFCWVPVVPFWILLFHGSGKKLVGILQVSLFFIFCLMAQSTVLKNSAIDFKIVFAPFEYFGSAFQHLSIFIAAVIFPLSTLAVGFKEWKNNTGILLVLMTLQGLILSFCFYDRIKGIISPNMTWQSSIMHYLLFLYGVMILNNLFEKRKYLPALIPSFALIAQVCSGLLYLKLAIFLRTFYF